MYLSKVVLNPLRRATREWVASPQKLHAGILGGFPHQGEGNRPLWRLEQEGHRLELLVVSRQRPDFTHLVEFGGWETAPAGVLDYGPFLGRIGAGQRYFFRLKANTVRSARGSGGRGKVTDVGSRANQEQWLVDRAAKWGFELPPDPGDIVVDGTLIARKNLALTRRETLRFHRSSDGIGRTVTLATAQFDGLLEVIDPELLREALTAGVGRGKAYGCGLMSLAPAG